MADKETISLSMPIPFLDCLTDQKRQDTYLHALYWSATYAVCGIGGNLAGGSIIIADWEDVQRIGACSTFNSFRGGEHKVSLVSNPAPFFRRLNDDGMLVVDWEGVPRAHEFKIANVHLDDAFSKKMPGGGMRAKSCAFVAWQALRGSIVLKISTDSVGDVDVFYFDASQEQPCKVTYRVMPHADASYVTEMLYEVPPSVHTMWDDMCLKDFLTSQVTHTFKPGEMGITCDEDGTVREVTEHAPAHSLGIKKGDHIVQVGTDAYSKDALACAEKGGSEYQVAFKVDSELKSAIEKLPDETQKALEELLKQAAEYALVGIEGVRRGAKIFIGNVNKLLDSSSGLGFEPPHNPFRKSGIDEFTEHPSIFQNPDAIRRRMNDPGIIVLDNHGIVRCTEFRVANKSPIDHLVNELKGECVVVEVPAPNARDTHSHTGPYLHTYGRPKKLYPSFYNQFVQWARGKEADRVKTGWEDLPSVHDLFHEFIEKLHAKGHEKNVFMDDLSEAFNATSRLHGLPKSLPRHALRAVSRSFSLGRSSSPASKAYPHASGAK